MNISYDNKCFYKDGKPWFPIMGEYEYSRCDERYWREGLQKMKATGCNTVQFYSIWIHHEEEKGVFDFSGNKNLRKFLSIIKEEGMLCCMRIGPWVHGEVRNGGFPDWIYEQNYMFRSRDAGFMADVEKYFTELYKQADGFMIKQGGPVFAVQIENELQASSWGKYGLWGGRSREEAENYVRALTALAIKIGFDVPVFFATGWGNAIVGDAIPCFGGYCEAPWENHSRVLPPSNVYLFNVNLNYAAIGEYKTRPEDNNAEVLEQTVPFATIEQGAGIQMTDKRRPIVRGKDNGAIAICNLGKGVADFGYYVYHGGINPKGKFSTMQEYHDAEKNSTLGWGFSCNLNEFNYDFQAAISQYGKIEEGGRELKLWNYLASEFEAIFCKGAVVLPSDGAKKADDFESPRLAFRVLGKSGFAFFNNFSRSYDMPDKMLKKVKVNAGGEQIVFDKIILKNGTYFAYPFNLKIGDMLIKRMTATPLFVLNGKDLVSWTWGDEFSANVENSGDGKIVNLSRNDALNSYKVTKAGTEYLIVANGDVYDDGGKIILDATDNPVIKIYPKVSAIEGFTRIEDEGEFATFIRHNDVSATVHVDELARTETQADYLVTTEVGGDADNVYLYVDFSGNLIELYVQGEKVNDRFYNGAPFEIALRDYGLVNNKRTMEMILRVFALNKSADIYLEKQPFYDENGVALSLDGVRPKALKKYELKF